MFGSVSREEYERERDARVAAEAVATTLRETIQRLEEELRVERERVTRLVSHIAPEPEKTPFFTGKSDGPEELSYEEIMNIPAVGRRGVKQRNRWAQTAKAKAEHRADEKKVEEQREILTEEEKKLIDESIPGKG